MRLFILGLAFQLSLCSTATDQNEVDVNTTTASDKVQSNIRNRNGMITNLDTCNLTFAWAYLAGLDAAVRRFAWFSAPAL